MIFDRSLGSKWSHGRVAGAFEDIVTWVKSSSSVWSMRPSLRIQEPKKQWKNLGQWKAPVLLRCSSGACGPNELFSSRRVWHQDLQRPATLGQDLFGGDLLEAIRNKKLLGTSASLLVTSALLVVTRSY